MLKPGVTSVVIPVRNGERFVGEALACAFAQLAADDEVLVVDDGSTDGTAAILAATGDPRLTVMQSGGRGVSAARNRGIEAAGGEFLAFLDHDDLWPQERHQALLAAITQDTALDAVGGWVKVQADADMPATDTTPLMDGKAFGPSMGSWLFRTRLVRALGGFDQTMVQGEDMDFYNRMVERPAALAVLPLNTFIIRRHGGNMTHDRVAARVGAFEALRKKIARQKAGGGEGVARPPA